VRLLGDWVEHAPRSPLRWVPQYHAKIISQNNRMSFALVGVTTATLLRGRHEFARLTPFSCPAYGDQGAQSLAAQAKNVVQRRGVW